MRFARESLHFDRPVSPLFSTTFVPAIQRGYNRAAHAAGLAPLEMRVVDGYVYSAFGEPAPASAPDARMLGEKVDAWERERVPEVRRILGELRDVARVTQPRRLAGELDRTPPRLARAYELLYGVLFETNGAMATIEGALAKRGDPTPALTGATLVAPIPSLLRDVDEWLAANHEADVAALVASPMWSDLRDRPAWNDLAAPTWGEEPERALRAARQADPARLREGTARARRLRDEAEVATLARFPPEMHAAVRSGLASARRAKSVAQTLNFLMGEAAIGAARRAYLQAGRALGIGADVVHLEHAEVVAALREGAAVPSALLDERRSAMKRWADAGPPPGPGAAPTQALRGLGGSPGVAEGLARVCLDEVEIDALRPGEVLVVKALPPSWTSASHRARAVVAELGGMLCHAAIVARELGVPAVVGVEGATSRIATGARVKVDGTRGEVELA